MCREYEGNARCLYVIPIPTMARRKSRHLIVFVGVVVVVVVVVVCNRCTQLVGMN